MESKVSAVILNQLGGGRFLSMTGAAHLLGGDRELQMSLPATLTKGRGNRLRVHLAGNDTYTITLYRCARRGLHVTVVAWVDGVYAENLPLAFESLTGLRTKL